MFPLRDTIRPKTRPVVNTILIVLNILVFFYEFSLGRRMESFIYEFGLTPIQFFKALDHNPLSAVIPIFTSMFLHGGWLHLLGNIWFLYIFGDNVEDRVGHVPYIFFYLLCGIGSALTQTFSQSGSNVPMVGASGAIAGVLGAYFMLYPHSKILTLVPIFIFIQIMEIPAVIFLFFWFLWQFIQGGLASTSPAQGGVAWWAHIGGFIVGLALIFLFKKREKPTVYWN
jgi:membrane associated rhomboid family serine protease